MAKKELITPEYKEINKEFEIKINNNNVILNFN